MSRRGSVATFLAFAVSTLASCAATRESADCRLTPIHAGLCHLGADHVLGEGRSAEQRLPFVIYRWSCVPRSGVQRRLAERMA
jgi:hypothetical protein